MADPIDSHSMPQLVDLLEWQLDEHMNETRDGKYNGITVAEITAVRSSLQTKVLPKLRSLESLQQPINRLPKEIFVLIPLFFTEPEGDYTVFPMNEPLISMTHVCKSWRNVLLSIPSLWTGIDFSESAGSQQAIEFLRRAGNQLLDIHQFLTNEDHVEPFLSVTLYNIHRLRLLNIASCIFHLEDVLTWFISPAPELKYLTISNDSNVTGRDVRLHSTIFAGQLPSLIDLSLDNVCVDLRSFSFPSLTRFDIRTSTIKPLEDFTSFFKQCPSLQSIQLDFEYYIPQPPAPPPRERVRLTALKDLRLNDVACVSGLLDHLALPQCTELYLKGMFTGETHNPENGEPAARIHPSSIDHLPITRGISKAVAMPNSCVFSGPNGNLRFWCFDGTRGDFDAKFFTSFSPIPVLEIRELWVGQTSWIRFGNTRRPWKQTAGGVLGAFKVLTKVEDLNIVDCETEAFLTTLGSTTGGDILLPGLRRLTIYVGVGDLDVTALVQCAKARKEYFRQLEDVTVVLEQEPGALFALGVESLREFVGELVCRVGTTPNLTWTGDDRGLW